MFEIWGFHPMTLCLPDPYARAHSLDPASVRHRGYEMNKALPSAIAFIVLLLAGVPPEGGAGTPLAARATADD